ncbi:hypothetical protein LJC34_06490 [Oscillospiraceae bacterium OttesenSCG-928-G22]|nr:hypothetical protein [Oscillospiraceae bacterium OttesenSCG-928-G22]
MKKMERFFYTHRNKGIKNLMLLLVFANAVFLIIGQVESGMAIIDKMTFDVSAILAGEVWRVVTFVFIPPSFSLMFGVLTLYFYYMIGSALEREWGVLKFNLYYLTGMLGTILCCFLTGASASATFINLSMFFAFATLYPDFRVLVFFIIPVKIKYLAYLDAAFFLWEILFGRFPENLIPIVALLNYILYFGKDFVHFVRSRLKARKHITEYQSKITEIDREQKRKAYRHMCVVCGRTDVTHPDMQFRYCSKCAGAPCYCEEHILDHTHIEE